MLVPCGVIVTLRSSRKRFYPRVCVRTSILCVESSKSDYNLQLIPITLLIPLGHVKLCFSVLKWNRPLRRNTNLTGDYIWRQNRKSQKGKYRPPRDYSAKLNVSVTVSCEATPQERVRRRRRSGDSIDGDRYERSAVRLPSASTPHARGAKPFEKTGRKTERLPARPTGRGGMESHAACFRAGNTAERAGRRHFR